MTGRRNVSRLVAATVGIVLLSAAQVWAHGLDPAALALRETRAGVFEVVWRVSALRLPGADVRPELPSRCRQIGTPQALDEGDRIVLRWTVDCGAADLAGETIGIADLGAAKINGLLSLDRANGQSIQVVLSPRNPSLVVPAQLNQWGVIRRYVILGVERMLTEADHVLFAFGLLLLVSTSRLLPTIVAFVFGHSITLSLAALGLLTAPRRPIELLIAVSVLIVALELTRESSEGALRRRLPWFLAMLFGLIHGFGFAVSLSDAGLPVSDRALALLAFNGGIELALLALVAVGVAVGTRLRWSVPAVTARRALRPAVYAIGILAAFWCYERLALWLA